MLLKPLESPCHKWSYFQNFPDALVQHSLPTISQLPLTQISSFFQQTLCFWLFQIISNNYFNKIPNSISSKLLMTPIFPISFQFRQLSVRTWSGNSPYGPKAILGLFGHTWGVVWMRTSEAKARTAKRDTNNQVCLQYLSSLFAFYFIIKTHCFS